MNRPIVRLLMPESLVMVSDGNGAFVIVNVLYGPRLLRDLAEATAKAQRWPIGRPQTRVLPPLNGEVRLSYKACDVEHVVDPEYARALAVALLIAADEAEVLK
jgi:hypothetical protein